MPGVIYHFQRTPWRTGRGIYLSFSFPYYSQGEAYIYIFCSFPYYHLSLLLSLLPSGLQLGGGWSSQPNQCLHYSGYRAIHA